MILRGERERRERKRQERGKERERGLAHKLVYASILKPTVNIISSLKVNYHMEK